MCGECHKQEKVINVITYITWYANEKVDFGLSGENMTIPEVYIINIKLFEK